MTTVQEVKVSLNNIEIEGGLLLELLQGVSTHAGTDKSLPTLNAVQIEGEGGLFIARATDRYRLIEGGVRSLDGNIEPSLLSLADIKRVMAFAKDHKANRVGIIRNGDVITVTALSDSITMMLLDGNYPPTAHLFSEGEGESAPVEGVAFNPAYMADYAKIAGKGNAVKIYFYGERKPMRVRITSDTITWKALLMPMKYAD